MLMNPGQLVTQRTTDRLRVFINKQLRRTVNMQWSGQTLTKSYESYGEKLYIS